MALANCAVYYLNGDVWTSVQDQLQYDAADPSLKVGKSGCKLGFFGTTPIAKETVTLAGDGVTDSAAIATALHNLGLITKA